MAEYSLILADLLTGAVRGRFRLDGLKYGRILDDAGAFSGTIAHGDRRALAKDPIGATTPARTAGFLERNESQILWGGTVWQRRRRGGAQGVAEIAGTEFPSYFRRREIVHTLVFAAQDQLAIARDLILYAQGQAMQVVTGAPVTYAKPGGNVSITVGSETSGVLRDATYEGTQHIQIAQALQDLARLDQGFDFSIDPVYSAGLGSSITRPLALSYPRRGRPFGSSTLRWEYGGNMWDYDWPEDATAIATTSYALGSGQGADMLQSSASAQYLIDAGYPLLEVSRSYKDTATQALLDAHARADSLADGQTAIVLPTITVDGSRDPQVGSFVCGDERLVVISDENFPVSSPSGDASVNTYVRIHAFEVSVDQLGRETVTITCGPPVAA